MAAKKVYTRIGAEVFITEIDVPDEQPKRRGRKPKAEDSSIGAAPSTPTDETP